VREGESVQPLVELARALPLVLTPAPRCPPPHRHSSFRQPPQRWPLCRFHRVHYRTRARHAAKSFRPCKLPDYSCQQIHSHQEGSATPLTPGRTSRKHTFEFSLSRPHFINRAGTAAPAPRARRQHRPNAPARWESDDRRSAAYASSSSQQHIMHLPRALNHRGDGAQFVAKQHGWCAVNCPCRKPNGSLLPGGTGSPRRTMKARNLGDVRI
jgi:hypothetical protein